MHCPKTLLVQSWKRYRRAGSQNLKLENHPFRKNSSRCAFLLKESDCVNVWRSYPSIRYHQSHNGFKLYMCNINNCSIITCKDMALSHYSLQNLRQNTSRHLNLQYFQKEAR